MRRMIGVPSRAASVMLAPAVLIATLSGCAPGAAPVETQTAALEEYEGVVVPDAGEVVVTYYLPGGTREVRWPRSAGPIRIDGLRATWQSGPGGFAPCDGSHPCNVVPTDYRPWTRSPGPEDEIIPLDELGGDGLILVSVREPAMFVPVPLMPTAESIEPLVVGLEPAWTFPELGTETCPPPDPSSSGLQAFNKVTLRKCVPNDIPPVRPALLRIAW